MNKLLPLRPLRAFADAVIRACALASFSLVIYTSFVNSSGYLLLCAAWVITPFLAFHKTGRIALRWSVPVQQAIYFLIITLSSFSMVAYGMVARPATFRPVFVFLVVPLVSWLLLMAAIWAMPSLFKKNIKKECWVDNMKRD